MKEVIGVLLVILLIVLLLGGIVYTLIYQTRDKDKDKNYNVTLNMTDTCDYQDGIFYVQLNVLIDDEIRQAVIPLNVEDTIYDEFKYGDGWYKTTIKDLICNNYENSNR